MGEEPPDGSLIRVSDADRQATAERLRLAHDEGRLSLTEYDQRLRDAYAATVRRDLDLLVADLPGTRPAVRDRTVGAGPAGTRRPQLQEWRSWAGVSVLLSGIWLITAVASGGLPFFWPVFPIGIWALVILADVISGDRDDEHGDDHGDDHGEHGEHGRHGGGAP